ncbi:MAG: trypsin-like serine protease [Deltaproteobacteria bacterium]|nr:MAG: trypsin-like serine protease [Deltaproteobacteria bacterium]
MRTLFRRTLPLFLMLWLGCNPVENTSRPHGMYSTAQRSVIYGTDGRQYTDDHPDTTMQQMAKAVVMLMSSSNAKQLDPDKDEITLIGSSLTKKIETSSKYTKKPLCEDEPFRLDPAPGSCTGFLIGPKRIMTAAHCVESVDELTPMEAQSWCNSRAIIFNFRKGQTLTTKDVYRCKRVLHHRYTSDTKAAKRYDIAVFELDREVTGVKPLELDYKPELKKADPVGIIGFPHGTYQKITTDSKVYDVRASTLDYFTANLDSMPGNSGSPVFSLDSYKVIGVHVRGARPVYVIDKEKDCSRSYVINDDVGKQSENYLESGKPVSCQSDSDCPKAYACDSTENLCFFRTTDLKITDMKLSANQALEGDTVTVSFTIQNDGNYDIATPFRIAVWWSTNDNICTTCDKDVELAFTTLQELAAGKTHSGKLTFTAKAPLQIGKQYIGLFVDGYKAGTQKYSSVGDIKELIESNNEKVEPFVFAQCKSNCTKEGETQCSQNVVEECTTQPKGCLQWQAKQTCTEKEICQKGACKLKCSDTCTTENETRCQSNKVEACQRQDSGCLDWIESQTCKETEECKEGSCVLKPKANGEPCQSNGDCASNTCHTQDDKGTCTQACQSNADCSESTRPYCQDKACTPLPSGVCLKDTDCTAPQTCQEQRCVAGPKPGDTGCSCQQTTPSQPSPLPFLVLVALFGVIRRR